MKLRVLFYGVLCVLITSCTVVTKAQNSNSNLSGLFEQYKQNKAASKLPDFSYVGYHYGYAGHEAITNNGATNILMENLVDEASMWHSFGSSHGAMNTVILRCTYPSTTCFEAHASQPRNTLFDLVQGGLMQNRGGGALLAYNKEQHPKFDLMQNRGGGALENTPNHMSGLVLWNYTQTNSPIKDFEFWPTSSPWWKIPNPIIVGFRGNGTTFNKEQVGHMEPGGKFVTPNSLYEAQLALRLKKLPE